MENKNPFGPKPEASSAAFDQLRSRASRVEPVMKGPVSTRDGGPTYETRRADLKPEVRRYVDKLYAAIRKFYAAYGVQNAADLYAKAKAREIRVAKEKAMQFQRMLAEFEVVLASNELPRDYVEKLPSLDKLKEAIEQIKKRPGLSHVMSLGQWDELEFNGGKLTGRVKVDEHWVPVIAGEPLSVIRGREFKDCLEMSVIDGKFNGAVKIGNRVLPVVAGSIIETINGQKILSCSNISVVNGELNGVVKIGDRTLPVVDGRLVEELNGVQITAFNDMHVVDGALNGRTRIGSRTLPVIDGSVVEKVNGREIKNCSEVRNIDGALNGRVYVNKKWSPVVAGKVLEEVDGLPVANCSEIQVIDGKLNGRVYVSYGGPWLPVINGRAIKEIDGKKIEDCKRVRNVDGALSCAVRLGPDRWLPVILWRLVEKVADKEMLRMDASVDFSDAGGAFTGRAMFKISDGVEKFRNVVLGEFVD